MLQKRQKLGVYLEFCQEGNVHKYHAILLTLVSRALIQIMKMTNPANLMSSMLNLLLARPLGTKNLLQRMFEAIADTGKTDKRLKEARKALKDKSMGTKVKNWVDKHYDPVP